MRQLHGHHTIPTSLRESIKYETIRQYLIRLYDTNKVHRYGLKEYTDFLNEKYNYNLASEDWVFLIRKAVKSSVSDEEFNSYIPQSNCSSFDDDPSNIDCNSIFGINPKTIEKTGTAQSKTAMKPQTETHTLPFSELNTVSVTPIVEEQHDATKEEYSGSEEWIRMCMEEFLEMKREKQAEELQERLENARNEFQHTWLSDKLYKNKKGDLLDEDELKILDSIKAEQDLRAEHIRHRDERNALNVAVRRLSREDTLRDIARECFEKIPQERFLPAVPVFNVNERNGDKEAILVISDWHYGIECETRWNTYNPEIAKERIAKLRDETIQLCRENGVSHLYILNLSDLIAGRIHAQIRITSRFDVITQNQEVTKLLAEFIKDIAMEKGIQKIDYYDCADNHSRIEPDKNQSLNLETLTREIPFYLKLFFSIKENGSDKVNINDSEFTQDIIKFKIGNYNIGAVHGDKDKPNKVVANITLYSREVYDLILTAHLHHFSCNEDHGTLVISNGSLMGTDDYAEGLRLFSNPSQTFILLGKEKLVKSIHKIDLN